MWQKVLVTDVIHYEKLDWPYSACAACIGSIIQVFTDNHSSIMSFILKTHLACKQPYIYPLTIHQVKYKRGSLLKVGQGKFDVQHRIYAVELQVPELLKAIKSKLT